MFILKGFGGCFSDKVIVEEFGILNYFFFGDEIMVDWGFIIGDFLFFFKVKFNILVFIKGKD